MSGSARVAKVVRHVAPLPDTANSEADRMPVIIGVNRVTPRIDIDLNKGFPPSPVDHMEQCARAAARDTGLSEAAVLAAVTGIAYCDQPSRTFPNMARSLGLRLGVADKLKFCHGRAMGGDAVQAVTNLMADRVAKGHDGVVIVSMCMTTETLRQVRKKFPEQRRTMLDDWKAKSDPEPVTEPGMGLEVSGAETDGVHAHPKASHTKEEQRHGLNMPINVYPLIENRLRARYGAGFASHQAKLAGMMAAFSQVAASDVNKEHAWIPIERTAEEIAYPTPQNRWIGYPYTKYMCANDNIDGAAAWLVCSVGTARQMGVSEGKWVYLLGGAHAHEGTDQWHVTARPDLSLMPGMQAAIAGAFASAGMITQKEAFDEPDHTKVGAVIAKATGDRLKYVDLYSCFPCVVQMAADTIGQPLDASGASAAGLTMTGGLPFYGQFACSSGALVATVEALRKAGGSELGLVTGNGGYAQKHSAGLYSATPPAKLFALPDLDALQASVNSRPSVAVVTRPRGAATIETFTVHHDRDNHPFRGVIVGILDATSERFIANVAVRHGAAEARGGEADEEDKGALEAVFARMMSAGFECTGAKGTVTPGEHFPNQFVLN